jgi:hypothetical protein
MTKILDLLYPNVGRRAARKSAKEQAKVPQKDVARKFGEIVARKCSKAWAKCPAEIITF